MSKNSDDDKHNFFYPKTNYRGDFSPNNPKSLLFNANLQEFAQKVAYICALETNGKISTEQAYKQIKQLWRDLKASKKKLLD